MSPSNKSNYPAKIGQNSGNMIGNIIGNGIGVSTGNSEKSFCSSREFKSKSSLQGDESRDYMSSNDSACGDSLSH